MTKIIEWRQPVLSELPMNEDIFVEKFLMESIQELCRKCQCFTEDIADVSVSGDPTHTLVPVTANTKVVRFLYGKYLGRLRPNKTVGEMNHSNPKWQISTGTPNYIVYEGGNTIRWSKIPDKTGDDVTFTVSLIPTSITDSDIPRQIEDEHLETVKDYVKWKIYMMPIPELFNEKLALYHKKEYESGRSKLRISVLTGFSGNPQVQQVRFV
jgi:hypothetical protein